METMKNGNGRSDSEVIRSIPLASADEDFAVDYVEQLRWGADKAHGCPRCGDVTTNTAESFFALLKRGVYGAFHAVSKRHLHGDVSEFEFRWNHRRMDDGSRVVAAVRARKGKRLYYREPAVV